MPDSTPTSWAVCRRGSFPVLQATIAAARKRRDRKASVYKSFNKNPYFLLNYYVANLVFLIVASFTIEVLFNRLDDFNISWLWLAGLVLFVLPNFSLIFISGLYYAVLLLAAQPDSLSMPALALIPVGILAGTISAALMHNAAHGNFSPKWSNRLWGEVCGLLQLTGFVGWCVSHTIHHGAPDNPERDAHPPGNMTFGEYTKVMGHQMKNNITNKYFEIFGRNKKTETIWSTVIYILPATRYMRVLLILFVFGPAAFVFFYVPFKIANALIYVDFNYRTHRPTADGGFEVLNLNHNLWYRLLNAISFGSYFHKNHHRKPNVFNPRYAATPVDLPLVTYHSRVDAAG